MLQFIICLWHTCICIWYIRMGMYFLCVCVHKIAVWKPQFKYPSIISFTIPKMNSSFPSPNLFCLLYSLPYVTTSYSLVLLTQKSENHLRFSSDSPLPSSLTPNRWFHFSNISDLSPLHNLPRYHYFLTGVTGSLLVPCLILRFLTPKPTFHTVTMIFQIFKKDKL